jgi:DNA repair protein RecN (Recombination protein N)
MLRELYIENFAIIEKAVIAFTPAFNVFSGETGAGKSILIGGINAVLGGRVSKDIVRSGAKKATVTALFDNIPPIVREKLNEYGYDDNDDNEAPQKSELVLTREISENGSSTARINGKTATAAVLREVAAGLIDIHGQHKTRMIVSKEVQLELIDNYGGISPESTPLREYENTFREFSAVSKKIKALQKEALFKNEKLEILTAKIADIEPYKLKAGEESVVSNELNRLRNIQTISEALNRAYFSLNGSESQPGAVDLLNLCKMSLGEAAGYINECKGLKERVEDVFIELDDIKREIASLISDNTTPEKLPLLEERMSDFLRLRRKYGLGIDELAEESVKWKSELEMLQGGEDFIAKLESEKKQLGDKLKLLGSALTLKRKQAAAQLSERICNELAYLDMPGTRLVFDIKQDKVTITGMDSAEMLISVNKGEELKPLSKIASGGELSRIMLAIKVVIAEAEQDSVQTMIFDEIDSGISGRAAHKVGLKLSELSRERQVLCVTHLAQIAAMADNHLLIEKYEESDRTYTVVKSITGDERKRELARIISGDDDELSLANAERLIARV